MLTTKLREFSRWIRSTFASSPLHLTHVKSLETVFECTIEVFISPQSLFSKLKFCRYGGAQQSASSTATAAPNGTDVKKNSTKAAKPADNKSTATSKASKSQDTGGAATAKPKVNFSSSLSLFLLWLALLRKILLTMTSDIEWLFCVRFQWLWLAKLSWDTITTIGKLQIHLLYHTFFYVVNSWLSYDLRAPEFSSSLRDQRWLTSRLNISIFCPRDQMFYAIHILLYARLFKSITSIVVVQDKTQRDKLAIDKPYTITVDLYDLISDLWSLQEKKVKAPPQKAAVPTDVSAIDLRVGILTNVRRHENADSLYVEDIQCGEEQPRQVVSGLVKHIPIEEMEGRRVVIVANLKAGNMRGVKSHAMVLAASSSDGSKVCFVI